MCDFQGQTTKGGTTFPGYTQMPSSCPLPLSQATYCLTFHHRLELPTQALLSWRGHMEASISVQAPYPTTHMRKAAFITTRASASTCL